MNIKVIKKGFICLYCTCRLTVEVPCSYDELIRVTPAAAVHFPLFFLLIAGISCGTFCFTAQLECKTHSGIKASCYLHLPFRRLKQQLNVGAAAAIYSELPTQKKTLVSFLSKRGLKFK